MSNISHPVTDGTRLKSDLLELARVHLKLSAEEQDDAASVERLKPLFDALATNVFRVVVMGEIKKGKSSFINALLGQTNLLPTSTDVATSTVYKIIYGDTERLTVFFQTVDEEAEPQRGPVVITRDELADFGTEDGNPGNKKHVDFIAVELPHPILAEGIAIIDTPGVGGLFKQHRDVTFRYAPQADAVFFVLDSVEAVISEDEVSFLRELRKNTEHIIFLQTKIDLAGTEQVAAWKERNLGVLSDVLGVDRTEIPYFLVGAKQKARADRLRSIESLQESGYLHVLRHLREVLIPARDRIVARRWLPLLASELLSTGKLAQDRLAIARDSSRPALETYQTQLAAVEKEFERWQNEVWPVRHEAFQVQTRKLNLEVRARLQDELSTDNPDCAESLKQLRHDCETANSVDESSRRLLAEWAARWNARAGAILQDYRTDYLACCSALLGEIAEDLQNVTLPDLTVQPTEVQSTPPEMRSMVRDVIVDWNIFSSLQRVAYGVGKGTGIVTAAGLLAIPAGAAIGWAASIGFLAVSVWSVVKGFQATRTRQRDAAAAAVERAMSKMAMLAARGALRILEELTVDLSAASGSQLRSFAAKARGEFAARRQEIVEARGRTAAESKAAEESLKARLTAYQDLLKQFRNLQQELA